LSEFRQKFTKNTSKYLRTGFGFKGYDNLRLSKAVQCRTYIAFLNHFLYSIASQINSRFLGSTLKIIKMCLPFKELLTIETNRQPKGIVMKGADVRGEAINTRVVKLQPVKKPSDGGQTAFEGIGSGEGGGEEGVGRKQGVTADEE
jgi:hypothetical protein